MLPDDDQLKKGAVFPIRFDGEGLQIYFVNSSNNNVASATSDGIVTINGPGEVILTIGFRDESWQFTTQKYLIFTVPEEAPQQDEKTALGDVNSDNSVDAGDASEVLMEYSRMSTGFAGKFTDKQKKAGDLDGNGKIDATDATMILQYYSYLSTGGKDTIENFFK